MAVALRMVVCVAMVVIVLFVSMVMIVVIMAMIMSSIFTGNAANKAQRCQN